VIKETIELNKEGKRRVLVVCGIHGNESQAVKDVYYLKGHFKNTNMVNSNIWKITFVVANRSGLLANTREYQTDNKSPTSDFNRSFPWKEEAQEKETIVEELKEEVKNNDIIIDVHNSPNCIPCVLVDWNGPRFDVICSMLKTMPRESMFTPVIRYSGVDSLKNYANNLGKFGFTVELGGMGFPRTKQNGFARLFNFINFIADLPADTNMVPFYYEDTTRHLVSPSVEGIISWEDEEKSLYKKGTPICEIDSFCGKGHAEIVAPYDCILVSRSESYYVGKYSVIAEVQPIEKKYFKAWSEKDEEE
jgi:predicted deacylase